MALNCEHCGEKVNVTTKSDYINHEGKLFCDASCKGNYFTPNLRRTKPPKKKAKLPPIFECPNCKDRKPWISWKKTCTNCEGDHRVKKIR